MVDLVGNIHIAAVVTLHRVGHTPIEVSHLLGEFGFLVLSQQELLLRLVGSLVCLCHTLLEGFHFVDFLLLEVFHILQHILHFSHHLLFFGRCRSRGLVLHRRYQGIFFSNGIGVGFGIGSDFRLLLSGLLLQCRHLFLQFSQFFRAHGAGSLRLVQLLAQFLHLLRLASRLGANFVEKCVGHLHFLLVFGGDALHLRLHRRIANSTRLHLRHLQLVLKRFLLHFKVLNVAFKRSDTLGEGVVASLERTALVLAVFQAFAQRRIVGGCCGRHIAQVRRQHRGDVVDQCAWHLGGASRSRLTNSLLHLFLRRLLLRLFHSLVLTARHDALLHLWAGRRRRLRLLACRFHTLHGRFGVVAFGWRCIVSKRIDIG